jgi:Zn-dependent peptidase ImmA (M78 family)
MDRSGEVEELAEYVAEEHWGTGRVDPLEIARSCGMTFSFGRYANCFDGYLECRQRRFHIYIDLDSSGSSDSPRARFSFAHELGHYFLDWHRCALEQGAPPHGSRADFVSTAAVEREADSFAANLLLPKNRIRKEAAETIDAAEVRRLAARFGTSLSATAIRCARLSLAPLVVMRWREGRRAWCWSSAAYESRTGNRGFRQLDQIPQDSPTRATLAGAVDIEPCGTTLATWFPKIRAGSFEDDVLIEECISLGRYGALTLLRPGW